MHVSKSAQRKNWIRHWLLWTILFIASTFACYSLNFSLGNENMERVSKKKEVPKSNISDTNSSFVRSNPESENRFVNSQEKTMKEATFGAGCFWCIEACYKELKGINSVSPGYAGGRTKNPTYKEVCSGTTGHAEVARIVYDESLISFDELLEVFFFVHDPTSLNRQGADVGTQYRSVVFYHDLEQKQLTEGYIKKLTQAKVWDEPIVTEIVEVNNYTAAEAYHFNYLELNPENAYCKAVVRPKYEKFKKVFHDKLK